MTCHEQGFEQRENPDILISLIAVKQIMRERCCGGQRRSVLLRDERERERGPSKPATEMSGTAPPNRLGGGRCIFRDCCAGGG